MKSHCVGAAIVAAIPVCAVAQSSVTLYGIADVGMGFADNGQPGSS